MCTGHGYELQTAFKGVIENKASMPMGECVGDMANRYTLLMPWGGVGQREGNICPEMEIPVTNGGLQGLAMY